MSSKKIKAILFDLDDTLYDHRHSMLTGLKALQKKYECFAGVHIDEMEREHIRLMNEVHLNSVLQGLMTLDEGRALRFKRAFELYGVNADEKLSYEAAGIYRENYISVNGLVPGAMELLKSLKKKYKIGIITNNIVEEQVRKLKEGKIEHLVDVMLTSEEAGVTKPHPEIFNRLLQKLNVTADEVVMVGDYWNSDIIGAHALGIKCIWINVYGEACPDENMAVEISSLAETEKVLKLIIN
jgi:YjjG family noncanonical pyrimidine nucleotidase